MKKNHSSVDGFIPRRPGNQLGELHSGKAQKAYLDMSENRLLNSGENSDEERLLGQQQVNRSIGRSDIDESLDGLDNIKEPKKTLFFRRNKLVVGQVKRPPSIVRRIFKWFFIILVLAILGVGGYTAYKFTTAGHNIFQGSIFEVFSNQPLKQDSNGRSNFLILGTSEDDIGHDGANLTDSMLVVSIDQTNKNIYMFSVPRDLYVEYGTGCLAGYSGKINGYFSCVNSDTTVVAEQERLSETQKLVGDIFGIDIQYGVHVNHTVIKEAVDAVGGIDVDIQGSNGAAGILDRNFDWRCNFDCYLVYYDNGVYHLDGEDALYLSMARGDVAPTYGLGNSNFDREKNQQKILIALKDKAMSTGTLTNLGAITGLIDSLGNNLRTNIQTKEIRTLMQVASEVKADDVHTLSLVEDGNSMVTTGDYFGASVVMPLAGIYNYSDIRAFIEISLTSNPILLEAASIVVLNGSGEEGLGQTKADSLTAAGYNVTGVDNAPVATYEAVEIYQIGDGNSGTAEKLSALYDVTIKKTAPPVEVDGDVRFVIIFGATTI